MPKQSKRNKSAQSANLCKSFCYFWLSPKVESPYPTDSNLQSKVALICSYVIDFIRKLDSLGLDTSLRINATLNMTKIFGLPRKFYKFAGFVSESRNDGIKNSVILRALARSIHFGDLRITCDLLTLGESMRLIFVRFARFGLLRRIYNSPRNDEPLRSTPSLRGLCPKQSTPHTTFKGIQMQT